MTDKDATDKLELELQDIEFEEIEEDEFRVEFVTSRGTNESIFHHKEESTEGVILVGEGGGLNGPASIYPELSEHLLAEGISSMRLDYRFPNDLEECVLDTLIAIELLVDLNISRLGLVGWSLGGAVVIIAGVISDEVNGVVTISSQSYGTGSVDKLSPKALLVIHGSEDQIIPVSCSEDIFRRAKDPKKLIIYEGANHEIDQKRNEMLRKVEEFLCDLSEPIKLKGAM